MARKGPNGPGGLIVVDKPAGMTSHDVVSRVRRIVGSRRVGHAGTLDPMATGVLVLGVERSTKLLNHLQLSDKSYLATVRLGAGSSTDDAEGELIPGGRAAELPLASVQRGIDQLTGPLSQVPSAVSAIKVDGQRAYARIRAGESVQLAARQVTVSRFELTDRPRADGDYLDCPVVVDCSSGTYIRALARDLGELLGVGGHLTALRRSRVGPFTLEQAVELPVLAELADPLVLPLPEAIALAMRTRTVTAEQARELSFGRSIEPAGIEGEYGALDGEGVAIAILRESDGRARPVLGFTPAG